MAHFAEIVDGKVIQVLVVPDAQEHRGQDFLAIDLGFGGTWIQTSYNGNIRKNYAGIGYSYWPDIDAFVAPQCHDVAVLDETTAQWNCTHTDHDITKELN